MTPSDTPARKRWLHWLHGLLPLWPYAVVLAAGIFILWPVPAGIMPMSQDHPVHMGRAWIYYETLKAGHLTGWSPHWYFGFPIGELYPPMGDLLMAAVRTLSFGALSWASCYAFIFASAFISCGLILVRVARLMGLSRFVGAIAGVLILWDPGSLREGGWRYTVYYGVWLQPFATAMVWWAFASLAKALDHGRASELSLRKLIGPGCLLGLGLLTHPIVLPLIAAGSTFFALIVGLRSRLGFARTALAVGITALLGLCVAAWWVLPLIAHRHWMGSYGVLHSDVGTLLTEMLKGRWTRNMPHAVGAGVLVGMVYGFIRGNRTIKFGLTFALCLWVMSQSDFFWMLRLDWLSEGFRHLQYQRFLTSAKPAFYLAAGLSTTALAAMYRRAMTPVPNRRGKYRPRYGQAMTVALFAGLLGAAVIVGQGYSMQQHHVGTVQVTRYRESQRQKDPHKAAQYDRDYARFVRWAEARHRQSDDFFRLAFRARRHDHTFTDAIAYTHTPSYKLGFTPGETFIHKPESGRDAMLDRLRVRYFISRKGRRRGEVEVARFGELKVWERDVVVGVAEVEGEGEVTILEEDYRRERVRVELAGSDSDTRLIFNIAGYPRWQLTRDGEPVEWIEVPVHGHGPAATQSERREGKFRGGRPIGSDGSEPTLIAVDAATDGVYELTYQHWLGPDKAGFAALLFAGLLGLLAAFSRTERPISRVLNACARFLRPAVFAVLGVVVGGLLLTKYINGMQAEAGSAVGWSLRGHTEGFDDFEAGAIKIRRLIGPAIILGRDGATGGVAEVTFPKVRVPDPDPSLHDEPDADTDGATSDELDETTTDSADSAAPADPAFPAGGFPSTAFPPAGAPYRDPFRTPPRTTGSTSAPPTTQPNPSNGEAPNGTAANDPSSAPANDPSSVPDADDGEDATDAEDVEDADAEGDDSEENTPEPTEPEIAGVDDRFEPIVSDRVIHGWFGVQDDALRRNRRGQFDLEFEVAARPAGTQTWTVVLRRDVLRAYGKRPLEIPIPEEMAAIADVVDLRVRLYDDQEKDVVFGFDLELGTPAN